MTKRFLITVVTLLSLALVSSPAAAAAKSQEKAKDKPVAQKSEKAKSHGKFGFLRFRKNNKDKNKTAKQAADKKAIASDAGRAHAATEGRKVGWDKNCNAPKGQAKKSGCEAAKVKPAKHHVAKAKSKAKSAKKSTAKKTGFPAKHKQASVKTEVKTKTTAQ